MNRRTFLETAGAGGVLLQVRESAAQTRGEPEQIHPGVWRFHFGNPETITPVATRHYSPATAGLAALPGVAACPVTVGGSRFAPRVPGAPAPRAE